MSRLEIPPFFPHPLLRSGHLQTILGTYLKYRDLPAPAALHEVALDDGDRIVLHDNCPPTWRISEPVVLLKHGLGGCHGSHYMQRITAKLNAIGVRAFRMDLRGCGAGRDKARGHFHAGQVDDTMAAVEYVADLCDHSPIVIAGFSMSGNILLKLLGELAHLAPRCIDSAIAISPPIDLMYSAENLRRLSNRIYDVNFVRTLHRALAARRSAVPDLIDQPDLELPKRLFEFDDQFTAPLIGFRDAPDYYTQCSSAPLLQHIRVPTLLITAEDDPVIPVEMFRRTPISPDVQLHITRHGGHIGFLSKGGRDPDRRWIDWRVLDWVKQRRSLRNSVAPPIPTSPPVPLEST